MALNNFYCSTMSRTSTTYEVKTKNKLPYACVFNWEEFKVRQ